MKYFFVFFIVLSYNSMAQSWNSKIVCDMVVKGEKSRLVNASYQGFSKLVLVSDSSYVNYSYAYIGNERDLHTPFRLNSISEYQIKKTGDSCISVPYGMYRVFNKDSVEVNRTYRHDGKSLMINLHNDSIERISFLGKSNYDGPQIIYHLNQNVKCVEWFEDGFKVGAAQYFYQNGNVMLTGNYSKGVNRIDFGDDNTYYILKFDGIHPADTIAQVVDSTSIFTFFDSLRAEYPYLGAYLYEGKAYPVGDLLIYHRDGEWLRYNKNGRLIKISYYNKGVLQREETF